MAPLLTNRRQEFRLTLLFVYLLLTLGALVMILPFVWMVLTSVKVDAEIFGITPRWIPSQFDWANYADAYHAIDMGRLFRNTTFVTVADVAGQILLGAMAGYVFARLEFPGRHALFFALLITMMVPFEVLVLPIFLLIRRFPLAGGNDLFGQGGIGLLNSYPGLIFPGLISVYGVFIFRQFFQSFPREIEDAALIDGCSHAGFFWRILVPNSKPVIGTMGLFSFLWTWNDFLWPLVVVKEDQMKTLQLGLAAFNQEFGTQWAELMAASVMVTVPVIALFLYAQRFLVRGLATTGLKG
ncbi:carbohydrate ABC transporter permease [Litorilinea aerophila]|uniref:Carbohydrate ABC transporter permease n=1 Tax=Litorilinea aerophila TaxID=1204385 RepID=A0A540VLT4_9CHLR|nr:carbohydrate ABC transporter permease [Litorilinea aerophila]MCC9074957.1 carbohydrate ABC transporter permease [Litorilinea aerophila]